LIWFIFVMNFNHMIRIFDVTCYLSIFIFSMLVSSMCINFNSLMDFIIGFLFYPSIQEIVCFSYGGRPCLMTHMYDKLWWIMDAWFRLQIIFHPFGIFVVKVCCHPCLTLHLGCWMSFLYNSSYFVSNF
jgi:hypothetical protein